MDMGGGGAAEVRHWNAEVNGVSIHVAEQGPADAKVVLLLHGFPELWLSWRHQMAALAARGFRALAPDLRGYGDSSAPADPAAYTIFHIVGDVVALLDHLQLTKVPPFFFSIDLLILIDLSLVGAQVFVVGHDLGAQVAWQLCLFRPDRVRAVVTIGVPFFPRGPRSVSETFAALGDGFYITQFQVVSSSSLLGLAQLISHSPLILDLWLSLACISSSSCPVFVQYTNYGAYNDSKTSHFIFFK
jgi:pimeloyl-ACP methyl ester carboxylesterase